MPGVSGLRRGSGAVGMGAVAGVALRGWRGRGLAAAAGEVSGVRGYARSAGRAGVAAATGRGCGDRGGVAGDGRSGAWASACRGCARVAIGDGARVAAGVSGWGGGRAGAFHAVGGCAGSAARADRAGGRAGRGCVGGDRGRGAGVGAAVRLHGSVATGERVVWWRVVVQHEFTLPAGSLSREGVGVASERGERLCGKTVVGMSGCCVIR